MPFRLAPYDLRDPGWGVFCCFLCFVCLVFAFGFGFGLFAANNQATRRNEKAILRALGLNPESTPDSFRVDPKNTGEDHFLESKKPMGLRPRK